MLYFLIPKKLPNSDIIVLLVSIQWNNHFSKIHLFSKLLCLPCTLKRVQGNYLLKYAIQLPLWSAFPNQHAVIIRAGPAASVVFYKISKNSLEAVLTKRVSDKGQIRNMSLINGDNNQENFKKLRAPALAIFWETLSTLRLRWFRIKNISITSIVKLKLLKHR